MTAFLVGHKLPEALWRSPERVHQIGALQRSAHIFTNIPVRNITEAVERAHALSNAGTDAYFACAEYLTPDNRTAANTSGAYAFWLDLDVGEKKNTDGKGYATIGDARQAVERFCKDAGLPSPTHIVNSGGGLHVYWVLVQVVDREKWQKHAMKLKALARKLCLRADDSRTADIASILRIPGTLNFKYDPPRPVLLQHAAAFLEKSVMLDAIDRAHSQLCDVLTTPRSSYPAKAVTPANGHIDLLRGILRHIDADREYDDWIRVGMALHHETGGNDDGLELFDAWSSTGQSYKGDKETAAKWRSFKLDHENPCTISTLFWLAAREGISQEMILAELEPFEICGGHNDKS